MNSELKKLNILLISPPIPGLLSSKYPNMGLAYIAASLLEEGHNVKILDIIINDYKKRDVKKILKRTKYDVYGIGAMVFAYDYIVFLSKKIKKYHPNSLIVAGGSVASSIPEILLNTSEVDIAVLGEGEFTIKDITKKISENDTDYSTIDGIYYKKNGQIKQTKERTPIENLDSIPMPAMHLYNMKAYNHSFYNREGVKKLRGPNVRKKSGKWKKFIEPGFIFPICTTRGCPFNCTFCYHCYQGYKVRRHSTERIIKEIKLAVRKYKNVVLPIVDDNFTYDKKRVLEFCDALENENLKVKWTASSRVTVIDEELIKRIKECGCVTLNFGIESGSQAILNNIKKQTTVEQAKNAILLCKKYGIKPMCLFMIGNQGENYHTALESYYFIKELNLAGYYKPIPLTFALPRPYPKTEIYEYAKKNGLIKNELKLINSFKRGGLDLRVNFSELSDKKLLQLKRSLERLINYPKFFFKNYYLDIALGKYFKNIVSSKDLKEKINNILIFFSFYYRLSIYFKLNLFKILKYLFYQRV